MSEIYNPNLSKTYGKGMEAFYAEMRRWESLTREQQQAEYDAWKASFEEANKKYDEKKRIEKEKRSLKDAENTYVYTDSIHTLGNTEATIIWLAIMGIGTIFVARWLIWILATFIWLKHMMRYDIRKAKWDAKGKAEWEENIKNGGKKNE